MSSLIYDYCKFLIIKLKSISKKNLTLLLIIKNNYANEKKNNHDDIS